MKSASRFPTFTAFLTLLLIGGSAVLFFYGLGTSSIHNKDEAIHSIVTQEILENEEWVSLTFLGEPYFKKPPLKFWLSAVTYKIGGVNEFTVRVWSAIFALGTVLALFLLGRKLYGDRAAFLGSLILLTSHQFIYNHCARTGELDSALLFFSTSALLLFLLAIRRSSKALLLLAFAAVGLVGMVKHIGFVPQLLAILLLLLALTGEWKRFTAKAWIEACGVLLLIVVPWHLAQYLRHGSSFVEIYLFREIVARAAGEIANRYEPRIGIWFYPYVLKNGFFPWAILLPLSIGVPVLERDKGKRQEIFALIVWLSFALLVVTISEGKYFWYALQVLPPACLLIGILLDRSLEKAWYRWLSPIVAAAAIVAALSVSTASTHNPFAVRAPHEMVKVEYLGRLGTSGGAIALGIAVVLMLAVWFIRHSPAGRAVPVLVLVGLASWQVASPLKFTKTRNPVDRIVSAAIEERQPREAFAIALPGKIQRQVQNIYYFRQLGPEIETIKHPDLVAWRRSVRKPTLLITTTKEANRLQADARQFGRRRTAILRREPPLAVVRLRKYRARVGVN